MGKALKTMEKQAERQSVRLAFSLCAIVALHYVLFFTRLYWEYRWLDIPMHFISGAWVAAFGYYFLFVRGPVRAEGVYAALVVLGFTALVGVLWEFHEFVFDTFITDRRLIMQESVMETIGDLFFDLLGGSMTIILRYVHFLWNKHSL